MMMVEYVLDFINHHMNARGRPPPPELEVEERGDFSIHCATRTIMDLGTLIPPMLFIQTPHNAPINNLMIWPTQPKLIHHINTSVARSLTNLDHSPILFFFYRLGARATTQSG